ncbi:YfdX protein [Rhizobium sp. RU20A]|uniref:YfdX family protein n=1 Tax=Rhizobium sp. RU20A TaxID=1907412 RepID=UPI000954F5F3|nr:YfdX family protein [Rhizobium sp. RU20A]SIQ25207.1 YfdX protein [Rhizobium sp. RU20A]
MLDKKIDQDVGRLSKDGAKALSDIQATRLAIFNAQPDQAKTLIHQAKVALAKAAKDDAVFMKPESELTAPGKATTPEKVAHAKAPSTTPVARLPVDSQLTLAEDFKATPEKMAAISDANQSLKTADRKGALEKLAVADVDVQFVSAVLPLEQTMADVTKAASLIDEGKYFEANAFLKDATDHAMLNIVDVYGQPYKAKAQKTADAKAPLNAQKATTSAN